MPYFEDCNFTFSDNFSSYSYSGSYYESRFNTTNQYSKSYDCSSDVSDYEDNSYDTPFYCMYRHKKGKKKNKVCGCKDVIEESGYSRCKTHYNKK